MKWEINILPICTCVAIATIYKCVRVQRTAYVLAIYLELGTLFFDAVKSLSQLSSASIRILEKRETMSIPEFWRFCQSAKHNSQSLFVARCTTHFLFYYIEIGTTKSLYSDNVKTAASVIFMINAELYLCQIFLHRTFSPARYQDSGKRKSKTTSNDVMTSCTNHKERPSQNVTLAVSETNNKPVARNNCYSSSARAVHCTCCAFF